MNGEQKVKLVFEFDRSAYDAYLFLISKKKRKRRKVYGMR